MDPNIHQVVAAIAVVQDGDILDDPRGVVDLANGIRRARAVDGGVDGAVTALERVPPQLACLGEGAVEVARVLIIADAILGVNVSDR